MKPLTTTAILTLFTGVIMFPMTPACAQDSKKPTRPLARAQSVVHHYFSKGTHKHAAKWSYTGKSGPKFWGTLSPSYHLARDGRQQSPIDIRPQDVLTNDLPPLRFDYRTEQLSAINNGHTIQHDEEPGSFLRVGKQVYALEQFHVHVPSEHTIDGRHAEMEVHLVHKSRTGQVAVVAVLANAGTESSIAIPVHARLPKVGDVVVKRTQSRNPAEFIPKDRRYISYTGSFTTPPCTEDVRWFVLQTPVKVAPTTLAAFRKALGHNNRPVQPLYDRQLTVSHRKGTRPRSSR
jgi:carbonic anhydrase